MLFRSTFFQTQEGRGKACEVHYQRRAPLHWFFAYPEDFSTAPLTWAKSVLDRQPLRPAFEVVFVYNESYDQTNTCKSLLKALRASHEGPVLWMNGDVVFDPAILQRLKTFIDAGETVIAVNTAAVSDEEVKYTVDSNGMVAELSKTVVGGLGEAVGINAIAAADKAALIRRLDECADQDYFERGMMEVRSIDTIEEMKTIVRDDGSIMASGRNKDDRVIAAALAVAAFEEQLRPRLIANRITRASSRAQDMKTPEEMAGQRSVSTYLKNIGMLQ